MFKNETPKCHFTKGGLFLRLPEVISGAEGESGTQGTPGSNQGPANSIPTPADVAASIAKNRETENDPGEEPDDKPNINGLKSALASERRLRENAERELKKRQKAEADRELAEKTEVEQAKIRADQAAQKVTALAQGLLREKLDNALVAAANKAKFIDPSDMVLLVDRSQLVYTQDEDNPAQITIDQKVIDSVVKELATKKPHLVKTGTDDGEPTGSAFGGPAPKGQKPTEDALREMYPSLS